MRVYLDYAATTPVKKEVLQAMLPYFKNDFGNPSSIHSWGRIARASVDRSREIVAKFLGAENSEIIFTSGATEANNLAITGLIRGLKGPKPHIITSKIEHHAVLHPCQALEKEGLATVTYLQPNKDGIISPEDVSKAIKEQTRLVSIMYVNNEIGAVAPIREIGKMIESVNRSRSTVNRILFHTDAVQGIGYLPHDVRNLHVDLLSFSAHKIYGPKSVGALYVKKGVYLRPIIFGGAQEMQKRAGTENVAGIAGMAKAIELIDPKQAKKTASLKDYFTKKVCQEIPEVFPNCGGAPHIANLYFKHIEGESIVLALDLEGVACSTGSACTSQSLEPSHVIMAISNDPFRAAGSVRFSFGEQTTKKELDFAISKVKEVVKRLRKISPYGNQ